MRREGHANRPRLCRKRGKIPTWCSRSSNQCRWHLRDHTRLTRWLMKSSTIRTSVAASNLHTPRSRLNSSFPTKPLRKSWGLSPFPLLILRWVKSKMNCKGKWRKKSDASSVRTSHTNPWSVETAANYFASIVKSRFAVARMMNYTSWISMSLKSKLKWHPCNPMRERATSLRSRKESLCPRNWPKVKCAAPTVESRVNSCREWT